MRLAGKGQQNQSRLDDFLAGGSAVTVTVPALRSTDQSSRPSGTAPSTVATPSGIVTRRDSDLSRTRWMDDSKVPGTDSPLTLIGGRLHNYSLYVGA